MRFLVVTTAPTLKEDGQFAAYAPYVNEMDIWFRNVKEVGILSPTRYPESVFSKRFDFQQIKLFRLPFLTFISFVNSLFSFFLLPIIIFQVLRAFIWSDHVHLRCPGNVGLIGCFVQILFPKKPKTAKFAGNWDPQAEQPWTYRLQKRILSNTFLTRNMQVLIYGEWPAQSKNIVPSFTASFSEIEKAEVREKSFLEPYVFLFVGNLVEGKRPLEALKLVEAINAAVVQENDQEFRANSIQANLEIYGDGPQRKKLETHVRDNQLDPFIVFKGTQPLEELKGAYKKAHFVILPSRSEGWPKAIAEGMFFGCIPIATSVSCVPWMLDYGNRGILLSNQANGRQLKGYGSKEGSVGGGQWSDYIKEIMQLMNDPQRMKKMSEEAKKWSQQYTLEKFEVAIKEVIEKSNEKSSSPFGRGGGVG